MFRSRAVCVLYLEVFLVYRVRRFISRGSWYPIQCQCSQTFLTDHLAKQTTLNAFLRHVLFIFHYQFFLFHTSFTIQTQVIIRHKDHSVNKSSPDINKNT